MEKTTPDDRLQEKIAGICLIVGALLWIPTTQFEYSSNGMLFWAGLVGLVIYIVFVPGLLGVARLLRPSAPRLSVIVAQLIAAGCVAGASFQTFLMYEWAARTAGTPETLISDIADVTHKRVYPVIVIFSIQFCISLAVLGIGLYRSRRAPAWVAALLVIGAFVFPVGHIGTMLLVSHLAETILLVPLAWLGLRLLRGEPEHAVSVPLPSSRGQTARS
jgi:hypothetical protein